MASPAAESTGVQTRSLLEKYAGQLHARGMTLSENTIRTWFYLQNIDVNYREFAAARSELFAMHGLTPGTHFIASTGIEGAHSNLDAKVAMDAYAISGICPGQVEHLAAPEHLSPTHIYGVTFERASSVAWRDRKQVFISGTASIDRFGQIMHPGTVERQLGRTLENIEALLGRAGASITDMAVFLVYIRDPGDYEIAWRMMRERFGDAPVEVLTAPVCRPGWLIEVEGMAIIHASNPELPEF
jgi:enamine deaminase RidA (YjgF/YER057c/UK114 family)